MIIFRRKIFSSIMYCKIFFNFASKTLPIRGFGFAATFRTFERFRYWHGHLLFKESNLEEVAFRYSTGRLLWAECDRQSILYKSRNIVGKVYNRLYQKVVFCALAA